VTPGEIVIAETRKKRLSISAAQIELPGGPDNITVYVSKTGPVLSRRAGKYGREYGRL